MFGISSLILSTLFYSFGGLDLYLGFTTPFAPNKAGAAYTGKHLRTVEYPSAACRRMVD